jgi:hypothetical protein
VSNQTAPLFLADTATLLAALRMSGLLEVPGADGNSIVNEAIQAAVVRFYRELTAAQIQSLQGTAFTPQPTTADEAKRMLANLTEIRLVRYYLLDTVDVRFADANPSNRTAWNAEAPLFASGEEKAAMRAQLSAEIEDGFSILSGKTELAGSAKKTIRSSTIGPCNPNSSAPVRKPGGTLFPAWPQLYPLIEGSD